MFRIAFDQLTLGINGCSYTYPIDGAADITDFDDAWNPSVVSILLVPDGAKDPVLLPPSSSLWHTLAAAIMRSCAVEIGERFAVTLPRYTDADEHRFRIYEVL